MVSVRGGDSRRSETTTSVSLYPTLMESPGIGFRRILELAFCVAGIWSVYIYQGVLQEIVLLEKDPFHVKSTLVHIAAVVELGQSNELYLMAYKLVKDHPQNDLKLEDRIEVATFLIQHL